MIKAAALICLLLVFGYAAPAVAQGLNFSGNSDAPVQLSADDGIEWQSESSRVIARGHAKAIRGAVSVSADSLTAYYRPGKGGDEIWRIDADGDVVIASATEKATGYKATYDMDKAVVVILGKPARLSTPTDEVTATDALEYWDQKKMAVARGNAIAVQRVREQTIRADVLVAYFDDTRKKSQELSRAEAFGKVMISSTQDKANGDKGTYDAKSGIATLAGNVHLLRADNALDGGYLQINLNTGVSKMFPNIPGTAANDSKVRGSFVPEKKRAEATFAGTQKTTQEGNANGR